MLIDLATPWQLPRMESDLHGGHKLRLGGVNGKEYNESIPKRPGCVC